MDGEELTEQETALYDRQIRVWGADAQRRLSKSHILVYGMKGTVAEVCFQAQNFSCKYGDLSSFGGDFFDKFDVVIVSCCTLATKKLINEKCRKLSKRVAFYAVDCRDSCDICYFYVFFGLGLRLVLKKLDENNQPTTVECGLQYPSFQESISVPWRTLPRRVSKLYFAMRVIERFEESEGRNPGEISIEDLPAVLKLKKEICEAQCYVNAFQSLNESHIPNALLERLVMGRREFPPVCAIVGGILGQEVIKAISGKGDPLKNFFFFDAMDGKGVIEDISSPNL
uniref:THIF-type NAD/FAD binding fold domain-containing protein n=1 Tax=Manihot esculenta TaxID=3983 RepID=A0A2C9UJ39_MANES